MNVFNIKNDAGSVILVQLTAEKIEAITTKSNGDVTLIYNEANNELIGFNLFNALKYMNIEKLGSVKLTSEIVGKLQKALEENNVDVKLNVDLTPKFVVGHIVTKDKHPNADKLNVCTVDVGDELLQIVCGASNVEEGIKVVVAKVGAVMPSGMIIRDAELRGVASSGMICSATELELTDAKANTGILILDQNLTVGESYSK